MTKMASHSKVFFKKNILIIVSEMTEIVNEAIKIHDLENIQSLILAAGISVFSPLSRLIKKKNGGFLIKISSGNLNSMTIETNNQGQIRASFDANDLKLVADDFFKLPLNKIISMFVGNSGFLKIIYLNQKTNYESQISLQKGDFSTDLVYFFDQSQQIKSIVKNLINLDKNLKVTKAQSVIVQFLPNHSQEDREEIKKLFKNKKITDFMSFFENYQLIDSQNWTYFCKCTEKNLDSTLKMLSENEIDDLIKNFGKIEFKCNFCAKSQFFSKKDWLFAQKPFSLATVESLTGGAFAAKVVEKSGASAFFAGGLICYQNQIKNQLGIDTKNGVTNAKTALKMAEFGREFFKTKYVISFTGNAGPKIQDGKLGQVFVALNEKVWELNFSGTRAEIIEACIKFAGEKINEIRPGTISD